MAVMPRGRMGSVASELRCRCAWLHHGSGPRTYRIQGCGAIDPRPKAGSPLIVIPTAPSVPSCSKLSRYGLARAKHIERLVRRPTLTAPCARRPWPCCGSGRRNGLSDRTKKLTKEDMRCTAELLDKRSPIQGPCADSEEKHEPVSGVDIAVAVSLKVLDLDGRLEKRTSVCLQMTRMYGPAAFRKRDCAWV